MYPSSKKQDIDASVYSNYLKNHLCQFIHDMIIPNECVSVAEVFNDFGISFLCQFGSLVYIL